MNQFLRPFLELTVILPGMFLAYLPVSSYLRQKPLKLTAWLFPLLLGLCISGGFLSCFFQISTLPVLFLLLPLLLFLYHKTLRISIWKSGSIFLAVLRGFCLPQQPFPGGKCHYNCQPQSDRKRTVVSDQNPASFTTQSV